MILNEILPESIEREVKRISHNGEVEVSISCTGYRSFDLPSRGIRLPCKSPYENMPEGPS